MDPEEEFWNSYVYCGNDPINAIDPTGGKIEGLNTGVGGIATSMANAGWFMQLSENAPWLAELMWNAPMSFGEGSLAAGTFSGVFLNTLAEMANRNWEALENGDFSGMMPIGGSLRSLAVVKAWRAEAVLVKATGQGTRPWMQSEIKQLLSTGKVEGYVGHHINSVKASPELVGNPNNITFVRRGIEHLKKHFGNYRNPTKGPLIQR